ncbi:MAG: NAD(P)-binding domain-containing protein [Myxococcales bacterium]|nr:NAD(P)-binding domain-containing protein [Myxococcales bacterium]
MNKRRYQSTDVVVIGGGQAGLAMSCCLQARSIDHVVLERGRVAQRWHAERWDSLRLLTPNWQSRLPGYRYAGADPDGFMHARDAAAYLESYARSFSAPVRTQTSVMSVAPWGDRFVLRTDRGDFVARCVVIATGQCDTPRVPSFSARLSTDIDQVTPKRYKNPGQLADGGVLVVGASATGLQLAQEIHASGRPVTLAVGRHTRVPRSYRGRDIMWWLDRTGILERRVRDLSDVEAARSEPSLGLVGRRDDQGFDLGVLQQAGVRLTGRLADAEGLRVNFHNDLRRQVEQADTQLERLLARVDRFAARSGLSQPGATSSRPTPITPQPTPNLLNLRHEGIRTVLWATGYRGNYPWLRVPVLDRAGRIVHREGVTASPGLYALGLTFMRQRKSTFIDGVGDDAESLASHIVQHLNGGRIQAA